MDTPQNIAALAGPPLLGYLLNWCLYGILSVQVYWYYLAFPKDRWHAKGLVLFVYAIETAQMIMMTNDCWNTYAKGFGDFSGLAKIRTQWLAGPIFAAIVSCVVQMFYAYRLYLLSKGNRAVLLIVVLSILQLVSGIITGAQGSHAGDWSKLDSNPPVNEGLWLGAAVLADVAIAASMVYQLTRKQPRSVITRNIVNRLIRMIIETGTLTAVIAILSAILVYKISNEPIHATPYNILAMTYSISLLAVLNNRIRIVGGRETMDETSELHISLQPDTRTGSEYPASADKHPGAIQVRQDVYVQPEPTSSYSEKDEIQPRSVEGPLRFQSEV